MAALETKLAALEAKMKTVEQNTLPALEKSLKKEVRCVLGPTIAAADSIKNRNTTLHTLFN